MDVSKNRAELLHLYEVLAKNKTWQDYNAEGLSLLDLKDVFDITCPAALLTIAWSAERVSPEVAMQTILSVGK